MKANKQILLRLVMGCVLALGLTHQTFAIEGLNLQIRCPHVVLSWPSVEGENYIVQHRGTLSTNTPWVTLTNYLPAETGTNLTYFVHSNRVDCPAGQVFGMMLSSGGESELMKSATVTLSSTERTQIMEAREEARLTALFAKCEMEGRMPYECELKNHPPLPPTPEEIRAKILKARDSKVAALTGEGIQASAFLTEGESLGGPFEIGGENEPQPENGGGGGNEPTTGFYQVVKDGVRIWGVTNIASPLVLSGTVNIPFEAGNADPNNGTNLIGTLSDAIMLVDGVKFVGDGVLSAPPSYPWQFSFDTAYLENGDHTVQVGVFWFDANGGNDGTKSIYPSRYSDPVTITVSNAIYYPQWEQHVGEANISAYFLKTVDPDAAYQINITDTNGTIVKTLTGFATNGVIEAFWDLIDTNGVARTNASVDPEFGASVTVSATGYPSSPTKNPPPKKQPKSDWPEQGVWTVTYQDFFRHHYSANNEMQSSINSFAVTVGKFGGYYLWYPQPGETNDIGQTWPMRYYNTNHLEDGVTAVQLYKDSQMLLSMLSRTNSRNFFYDGHGSLNRCGNVSSKDIAAVVKHSYRFVFINACDSADGDLDNVFGIKGPREYNLEYYQKSGRRPAAFMGNHGKPSFANAVPTTINGVVYDGVIPWQVPYLYFNFLFYWDADLMGWDLYFAIAQAINDLPPIPGWSFQQQPGQRLKIYGYPYLRIDQYNHRTDWP